MRSDRPLIISVLLLATGLGLTFGYCTGNVGMNASYPLAGASFKLAVATYGPAAVGGPALIFLGLLVLLWALLCAIFGQIGLFGGEATERETGPTRLLE
jgi:hypothetical protein